MELNGLVKLDCLAFSLHMSKSMASSIAQSLSKPYEFVSVNPGTETPQTLPSNLYVQEGRLCNGGWKNALQRFFIPGHASSQDAKVSEFFMSFFKGLFQKRLTAAEQGKIKGMLVLAEQHIAHGKGYFKAQTQDTCRLEHYTLAARRQINQFLPGSSEESLAQKCSSDNKALLAKWTKLGFAEKAFWQCPDLVDFVFKSFLHRHITHPYYNHKIEMRPVPVWKAGQIVTEDHPHLLVDGIFTPWSKISSKIKIDADERLYSIENGEKKYWMYLDTGLTKWDKNNFDTPRRLFKLERPPLASRVEIITTHAHKEDWHLGDRFLKGTRHAFFRIVPGAGYSARNPNPRLDDGSVYSLGWGARWRDFSIHQPLSTLRGKWVCPDGFEFFKEDLCITPIDISDEKMIKLFEIVRKRSKEDYPFNVINANCCGGTADVLREAGVVNLCTKNHLSFVLYKFLFPKSVRYGLDKVGKFFESITPAIFSRAFQRVAGVIYSAIWAPFFTLLGAWRTNLTYEAGEGPRVIAANHIKALFSNAFDFFSPNKMEFDLTKNVYKWQKKHSTTYFEKHN